MSDKQLQFPVGFYRKAYWILNPRGHIWQEYEGTEGECSIDLFAGVSEGIHNGPLCVNCGLAFCVHCHDEVPSECPKPPGTKGARKNGKVPPEVSRESLDAVIEEVAGIANAVGREDEYADPEDWEQQLWEMESCLDAYRMGKEQGERELARRILKALRND